MLSRCSHTASIQPMVLSKHAIPIVDELRADNSIRKHIKNNLPGSIGHSELEIIHWKYWRRKGKKRKLTLGIGTEKERQIFIFIQALKLALSDTKHVSTGVTLPESVSGHTLTLNTCQFLLI